jgi:hypothetical protein
MLRNKTLVTLSAPPSCTHVAGSRNVALDATIMVRLPARLPRTMRRARTHRDVVSQLESHLSKLPDFSLLSPRHFLWSAEIHPSVAVCALQPAELLLDSLLQLRLLQQRLLLLI